MRTTIVAGAALGLSLLTAAPALAAPEVSRQSCDAIGGTFSREKGVKTCTRTTTHLHGDAPEQHIGDFEQVSFLESVRYIGLTRDMTLTATTTTQTQKGNGAVATTGPTTTVLDEYVVIDDCVVETWLLGAYAGWDSAPDEECQTRGLLPAS